MDYKDPVMSVKLRIPQPRKNYIIRQELFRQLENLKEYKAAIIKAGAGSGKTTLLTSFIKESDLSQVKWITLDDNLNQVFIFWRYVIEAMHIYMDDKKEEFQDFFDGNVQKDTLWQMLSLFSSKIIPEKEIILVLDDFQVITDEFLISTIDYFIENLPDNIHLVFLTRNLPALYLGNLAMEGNILILEEDSIRFSKDESLEFLRNTMNLDKEENLLEDMAEASGGWIGGLQLLAVSLKDRNVPMSAELKISSRMVDDYITREIFIYLSEEEQTFLIKTGILRYFNEDICKKYLPEINFSVMIESILKKNLFVINADEHADVYRYHAILSDYLVKRAEQLKEEERTALHKMAANAYYDIGDYEESLYHLFLIKDYSTIMEQLLQMPQNALTYAYIMNVPMEEIPANTDFAYQYFFCFYTSADTVACQRIYDFLCENMMGNSTFEAFKHMDMFFGDILDFYKVKVLPLDKIMKLPLKPVTISLLLVKEAYFLYASSKYQEAIDYLNQAEEIYKKTGNPYIGFFVLSEKAQIYEDMGELNLCLKLYKDMEELTVKLSACETFYYIGIAGVFMQQVEIEKARIVLENAQKTIKKDSKNVEQAYLYNLAEFSYITGDIDTTEKILMDSMRDKVFYNIYYSARLLRYPVNRGNHMDLARKLAFEYEASGEFRRWMECDLICAHIYYEDGNIEKALNILDYLISKARKMQNKLKIVECDLLKAHILLDTGGNKREIQNLFLESISYAVENNIALPFWFEKKTVAKLLKEIEPELRKILKAEEWSFIEKICSFNEFITLPKIKREMDDLTEREKEVLLELAKGSSNKEIADNLCISLATVKSHIINLYGKLGVNNRVAAVNCLKDGAT